MSLRVITSKWTPHELSLMDLLAEERGVKGRSALLRDALYALASTSKIKKVEIKKVKKSRTDRPDRRKGWYRRLKVTPEPQPAEALPV